MQDKIIDGKILAEEILHNLTDYVKSLSIRVPGLAVVLVGDNRASQIYVRNKKAACVEVGIKSIEYLLPETTSEAKLLALINELNQDTAIDGILVQLPLPQHLNSKLVIDSILPHKDVDGFHRYNMGSLALNDPKICPCTPHGIMYMLDNLQINYHGKNAVILGSSNIVGRPMALELLNRGATVTVCNSKTLNLAAITKTADILISAIGRANFVTKDFIKPGAIVIDVGINRDINGKLCGDVDFANVINIVNKITPVPGGVGKMTIAMLIKNTITCYQLNLMKSKE